VALRKARSILLFLKPVIKLKNFDQTKKAFRKVARRLSSLREMDVFLEDLEALSAKPGHIDKMDNTFPALKATVTALREKEQHKVQNALNHTRLSRIIGKAADPANIHEPCVHFGHADRKKLAERLDIWRASIRGLLHRLDMEDTKQVHKLRLRLKKFNYINDFVESCGLIPPLPLKGSKALQRDLGRLCDFAMHRQLLKRLMAESAEPLTEETKSFLILLGSLREECMETLQADISESR